MPQRLDLNAAGLEAYLDALRTHAVVNTRVSVLDLEMNVVANLTPRAADGQILVDRRSKVSSRALMMNFDDTSGQLDFDPHTPDDAALFLTHMLQVDVATWVEPLDRFVTVTPFLGPLRAFWRDGANIHVQAHGKELLRRRRLGDTLTIRRGTPKIEAIQTILTKVGETRFALPELSATMPRTISLHEDSRGWDVCLAIAESMNCQLYYRLPDGAATVRRFPTTPVFTFRTGDDGEIIGNPRITNEISPDFANKVTVIGCKPRGARKRVEVPVHASDGHALGIDAMGEVELILRNRFVRSKAEGRRLGMRVLNDRLLGVTPPRFEALPIYHLTEGDFAQQDTDDSSTPFRADVFTLPISTEGRPRMIVGDQVKTTPDRWVA